MYSFGAWLKAFRSREKYSQQKLANMVGVNRNTIANWERGQYRPEEPKIISAIIDALELSPADAAQLLAALVEIPPDYEVEQNSGTILRLAKATQLLATMPLLVVPPPAALPAGSRMPLSRNPLFVGRTDTLLEVAGALKPTEEKPAMIAVTGGGGIGKTNVASEFVHRYGQFFAGGVFWLSFDNPAAIAGEIAACATSPALGLPPEVSAFAVEDRARRVQDEWERPMPRLLIFDNCDDAALLMHWQPKTGGCRILVTSRWTAWDKTLGIDTLALAVFQGFESVKLLRRYRPDLEIEAANAIALELDHLPLALHLAGRYLQRYAATTTAEAYLRQLRQPDLLNHPSLRGHYQTKAQSFTLHDPHVARTFALSYIHLAQDDGVDALARTFLAAAAWLAPGEIIPRELLLAVVEPPRHATQPELLVEDAILRLLELGLVEGKIESAVRLHRLLAHFVRMDGAVLHVRDTVAFHLQAQLQKANDLGMAKPLLAWQIHARAVADEAVARQSERSAALAFALGQHLHLTGDAHGAYYYLQHALKIRQAQVGETHKDNAKILNLLGVVSADLSKGGMAHTYYERALAQFEQDDPDRAALIESLLANAQWFQELSEVKKARTYFERALQLQEERLGRDHLEVAKIQSRFGFLLTTQGELELAQSLLTQALATQARKLPENDLEIAQTMKHLGLLLIEMGDLPRARYFLEQTLAIRQVGLPPEHPYIAASLKDLANLALAEHDPATARPLLERSFAILEPIREPAHGSIVLNLNVLGVLLYQEGKLTEAQATLEKALVLQAQLAEREKVIIISHNVARINHDLGVVLQAQGDYRAAEARHRKALEIRLELFGQHHFKSAQSFSYLASVLYEHGNPQEAERYLQLAYPTQERVLGATHPDTVRSRLALERFLHHPSVTQ